MLVRRCGDGRSGSETDDVRLLPREGDGFAPPAGQGGRGALEVVLQDGETSAPVEVDDRVGGGAEIDDLVDHARREAEAGATGVDASRAQGDLLRADADGPGLPHQRLGHLTLEEVRGAHEPGDEG